MSCSLTCPFICDKLSSARLIVFSLFLQLIIKMAKKMQTFFFPGSNSVLFMLSRFTHDNIVTCSRDGSAIIWIPRSRRSHVSPTDQMKCHCFCILTFLFGPLSLTSFAIFEL